MTINARWLGALLTALCAACTTVKPLPDAQPATIREAVKPGDTVEITRTDGARLTLAVSEVTDEALIGTAGGKREIVLLNAVRSIGARRVDRSATTWTVVGVAAAIGLAVAVGGDDDDDGGGGGGPSY